MYKVPLAVNVCFDTMGTYACVVNLAGGQQGWLHIGVEQICQSEACVAWCVILFAKDVRQDKERVHQALDYH